MRQGVFRGKPGPNGGRLNDVGGKDYSSRDGKRKLGPPFNDRGIKDIGTKGYRMRDGQKRNKDSQHNDHDLNDIGTKLYRFREAVIVERAPPRFSVDDRIKLAQLRLLELEVKRQEAAERKRLEREERIKNLDAHKQGINDFLLY